MKKPSMMVKGLMIDRIYRLSLRLYRARHTLPYSSSIMTFLADSIMLLVLKSRTSSPLEFFSAILLSNISSLSYSKFSQAALISLNLVLLPTFVRGRMILSLSCLVPSRLGRKTRQLRSREAKDESSTLTGFSFITAESQVALVWSYFQDLESSFSRSDAILQYLYSVRRGLDRKVAMLSSLGVKTSYCEDTASLLFLARRSKRFSFIRYSQICFSIDIKEEEAILTTHSTIPRCGMGLQRISVKFLDVIISLSCFSSSFTTTACNFMEPSIGGSPRSD